MVISADEQRGRDPVEQTGEGGGVATQHRRAQQLGASGLLLGAGVPHDEEHHHQADAELGDLGDLVGDDAAEGVEPGLPARHQVADRAGADGAGVAGDLLRGVVERRHGECAGGDRAAETDQPQRQPHPVAAQDESQQVARRVDRLPARRTGAGPRRRPVERRWWHVACRHLLAVLAQEQLLQRRRVRGERPYAEPASAVTAASRWSESTSKVTRSPWNSGSCTPGTSAMAVARAARSRR